MFPTILQPWRPQRRRLAVHIILAASLGSTVTQFMADQRVNPGAVTTDSIPPEWASYLTPMNLFAGAVVLLMIALMFDGNWVVDNLVLPMVGVVLAGSQIVIDAGQAWLGVGAFVTAALLMLMRLFLVITAPYRLVGGAILIMVTMAVLSILVPPVVR